MAEVEEEPIRVVLCDDQISFLAGFAMVLQAGCEGVEVVGKASSATEAEDAVQSADPDIVLMDLYMPSVDGIEATRRITSQFPSVKVIVLTASDDPYDAYEALKAGALGYVSKTREPEHICRLIRWIHDGNFSIPAGLAGSFVRELASNSGASLTTVETEILSSIGKGLTDREIAMRTNLSLRTVRRRVADIYRKLHLTDRIQAALYANRRSQKGTTPTG
jgi:DNA-binding NarL/FixJ family response regulator